MDTTKQPTDADIDVEEEPTPLAPEDTWVDEKTLRIDFDRPTLSSEAKLVFGYLTLEQHDMFAQLSLDEQQEIARTLKG
jgi:hypothetical protein